MSLFLPFRALGYITDDVPFAVQRRGKETFITVSVGKAWQVRMHPLLYALYSADHMCMHIIRLACQVKQNLTSPDSCPFCRYITHPTYVLFSLDLSLNMASMLSLANATSHLPPSAAPSLNANEFTAQVNTVVTMQISSSS